MEIREIKQKQVALEVEIYKRVSELTEQFRKETGVSVRDILFHFRDVTAHSDDTRQFVLVETRAVLEI